ncbi:hypothetical protein EDD86DRAFT_264007 [Gorgonomyces haynaldii]|nr:hypothetical protein EDD86DRAFT_264007 [Gorgonomyces haynaldii]
MLALLLTAVKAFGTNDDGSRCYIGNCWFNHTEVMDWTYDNAIEGTPAWANDGSVAIGIEETYERKLEIPPLQGWFSKRNFYYRLFTQKPKGKKTYLTTLNKGQPSLDTLYFMKSAGYVLLIENKDGASTVLKYGLDGTVKPVVSGTFFGNVPTTVPSPNGTVLAQLACNTYDADTGAALDPYPCQLAFVDAVNLKTISTSNFDLKHPENFRLTRWTADDQFIVTDRNETAFSVDPYGKPVSIPLPKCTGAATTSSKVNAKGELVGVKNGNLAVVGTVPVEKRFNCQ